MSAKIHTLWLVAAVMVGGSAVAPAASAAATAPSARTTTESGFIASTYGTEVNVGSVVKSGRSAPATLGCTSQPGVTRTNTTTSVNVPLFLTTGVNNTSVASQTTQTGVATTATSDVLSISVLGGLVQATELKSVTTVNENSSTGALSASSAGTEFIGLTVAGQSITATPKANTKIKFPGSTGYVVLNQQQKSKGAGNSKSLTVIALHVYVTGLGLGVPVGTQVVVSFATSKLGGPVSGLLTGRSYSADAHVGKTVIAGSLFPETLGCLGTNGKTKTNPAASVTIPGILTSGTAADTVEGLTNNTTVSGMATSTVQGLNLLSGEVTATVIEASDTASGSPPALGDQSSFTGLSVAGYPGLGGNIAPNTKLSLAGLGTLWLHRVIKTKHSITVIMVQLDVTVASNPFGLKAGTTVNVAYAQIGVS